METQCYHSNHDHAIGLTTPETNTGNFSNEPQIMATELKEPYIHDVHQQRYVYDEWGGIPTPSHVYDWANYYLSSTTDDIKTEFNDDAGNYALATYPTEFNYPLITEPSYPLLNTMTMTESCPEPERIQKTGHAGQYLPIQNQNWRQTTSLLCDYAQGYLNIEQKTCDNLSSIEFGGKVTHIYNPLQHAYIPHELYVRQFCQTPKKILFLGMNPGPFGMAQTGVPFGEVSVVKEWLQITGAVYRPCNEHPKRPITGFDCKRKEVSGSRFWGFFKRICHTPEIFFQNCFVHNLCPLIFMNIDGKNLTPPDLLAADRQKLLETSKAALCEIVHLLGTELVIGVGNFAAENAKKALARAGMDWVRVGTLMHPSPANPLANKGWEPVAEKQLSEMGALALITGTSQ